MHELRREPNSWLGTDRVFYSYSHEDEDLREKLEAHLAPLRRSGLIREWHDRKIIAGQDWDRQISSYLETAELILFLISADFINSAYIFDVEVKRALERQSAGQAAVVPIILRPVVWKLIPEFSRLQALPENARPVTEWPSLDLAFVSICEGIAAVVLARASAASATHGLGPVASSLPTPARSRRRVLDAALPARVPLANPSTLLVLVRRTDSPGLRAVVQAQPEYGIAAEDIDSKPLTLKFPVDQNGTPQPLDLNVKIESPQFDPRSQTKSVRVPPRGDSLPRVFLLTPTQLGPLVVNVEICQGEQMIAGCVLHSESVQAAPGAEEAPPQNVASASLGMSDVETEVRLAAAERARLDEERQHAKWSHLEGLARGADAALPAPPPQPRLALPGWLGARAKRKSRLPRPPPLRLRGPRRRLQNTTLCISHRKLRRLPLIVPCTSRRPRFLYRRLQRTVRCTSRDRARGWLGTTARRFLRGNAAAFSAVLLG